EVVAPVPSAADREPAQPDAEPAQPNVEPASPRVTAQPVRVAAPVRLAAATPDPRHPGARPIPRREPIGPARRTTLAPPVAIAAPGSAAISAPGSAVAAPGSAPISAPPITPPSEPLAPAPAAAPPSVERATEPPSGLPPPAPPVQLKSAPPPRGSLDATPGVVSLEVKGSLSPSIVRRSVERTLSSLRACYRVAARAGGNTPAVELRLAFEIDENSLATHVTTAGASFGSFASCAAGVAGQIRTQEAPDVGTAQVIVVIGFRPS
ncbi:MAG: hypothetical protein ABIY55_04740, partial [Kofleriaceae bacterium]